jgi:hypothetical protein
MMPPAAAWESQNHMKDHAFTPAELAQELKDNIAALEQPGRSRRAGLFSALVSLALLVAVVWQLRQVSFAGIGAMVPRSPAFWVVFALFYLLGPASEWLIYRRVWARCCARRSATNCCWAIWARSSFMPGRAGG